MQGNEIIVPPQDIQLLIEKTAEFVAGNGSAVEVKIWESQKSNPKFSFLKHGDIYRAFYEQKIFEYAEKLEQEELEDPDEPIDPPAPLKSLTDPNPFCLKHPLIAKIDMDIIKTTALFTAKSGKNFWMGLSERESSNPQFSFLKPTHSLFSYFTSLIETYSRCLLPKLEDIKSLQTNLADRESILQRALDRFSHERGLERNQRSKAEVEEEERQQMSMIDWHDFVVVETIDFAQDELLPPPADPNFVPTMSLPLSTELENPAKKLLRVDRGVVGDISQYSQKCPVCRDMIPVDDFQEHLRLELVDPKYKQEKARNEGVKANEQVFASSSEIYKNLQNLSRQRPDLATSSVGNPGGNRGEHAGRVQNVPGSEGGGNAGGEVRGRPGHVQQLAGPRVHALPVMDKSQHRNSEEILPSLVPEKQWAQMHSGSIPLHVQIPSEGGDSMWGFRGQIIQILVGVTQTIGEVKNQLVDILGGMPVGKMKFKNNVHSVMKDNKTLAHYNIIPASIVELAVKERGGRRKNH